MDDDTTVGIPRELRVILDNYLKTHPRFRSRSALVQHIVWEWVKEQNGLTIEGTTAIVEGSA